jgi:putative hemolysin
MMQEGHEQGKIEAVEVQVMSNLFEFTDLRVEDAMTHRTELHVLSADGSLDEVVVKMSETGLNKFPVIDGNVDRIVGVLYSKDIVSLYPILNKETDLPSVKECMRHPYFVPENKMLVELFYEMKRGKERFAVVVDDYGGTSGIITLTDILEEIVGDLTHSSIHLISTRDDNSYLIDGRIEVEHLAEFLKLKIESEHNETFSGFLVSKLGYVPQKDEHPEIILDDYLIRVEEVEGGFIRSASAKKRDRAS